MSKSYFHATITQLPTAALDLLTELLFQYGASGTAENLSFIQPNLRYDPEIVERSETALDVFFDTAPNPDLWQQVRARWPGVQIHTATEPGRDWLEEWKKGYQSFEFVPGHWIVPSWLKPPADAVHVIKIDPGMAFGTGTHETTQLAAQLIQSLFSGSLRPERVVDVGSGTRILAILAEQLGAKEILALDIDPEARRVARENFGMNGCQSVRVVDESVEQLDGQFDLVIANIIDGVLLSLQADLKRLLRPGGWMVLSGILTDHETEFLQEFKLPAGSSWLKLLRKNEWLAVLIGTEREV